MTLPVVRVLSFLGALASSVPGCEAQQSVERERQRLRAYVDSAVTIMRLNSVRRDSIDWALVRAEARKPLEVSGLRPTSGDAYAGLRAALRALGDHHSFLMEPSSSARWAVRRAADNTPPTIRTIAPGLGYLKLPPYSGSASDESGLYAQAVHDRLRQLDAQGTCGWVVDLRGNSGGNMWPMLVAVGPILDTGVAGRFVSRNGSVPWGYRPGVAWSGAYELVRIFRPLTLRTNGAPVAVLTDSLTGSSGEAIAVAFRARPAARSFGRPTAGASTANETFLLSDGAQLFLTTAVFADRSGRVYGQPLIPDEVIGGPGAHQTSTRDADLERALTWLRHQPGCALGYELEGRRDSRGGWRRSSRRTSR